MKKFSLFLIFLVLIMFSFSFKPIFYDVFSLHNLVFSKPTYNIYCLSINKTSGLNFIDNGNSYIVKASLSDLNFAKSNCSHVLGESVSFVSFCTKVYEIIDFYSVDVKKEEKFDGYSCFYGYSNKISTERQVEIDGEKINIQIAFRNNILTIGTPIILGDY